MPPCPFRLLVPQPGTEMRAPVPAGNLSRLQNREKRIAGQEKDPHMFRYPQRAGQGTQKSLHLREIHNQEVR